MSDLTPDEMARDALILSFEPFQDDCDVRTVRNAMVRTRKVHACQNCGESIPAGARVRSLTQAFEGEIMTWRWCVPCCDAMATEWDGESDLPPFEARCKPFAQEVRRG